MSDEEVIRRRLMIDGDGTGDDRRLNNIIKGIVKWTNARALSTSDNEQMRDRLLHQIAQCEHSARRSRLLRRRNRMQQECNESMQREIDTCSADVVKNIVDTKVRLDEMRATKSNYEQYGLLTTSISKLATRSETLSKLHVARGEVRDLEAQSRALDAAIDRRRKECYVLSTSANAIRELYEQEDAPVDDDGAGNSLLDDIANSPNPDVLS